MISSVRNRLWIAGVALCLSVNAFAHHSFAMFEMNKTVTLKGTVRSYEWTNPHTWLWVYVTEVDGKPVADKDGNPVIWGIEGGAPGEAVRQGRTKNDLKPGDKITLAVRPLKDGRPGGSGGGKITFDDGRVLGRDPQPGNGARNGGGPADAAPPATP